MRKLVYLAVLICAVALASCSTIFCGTKAKVTFDSDVKETADLTIDGFKYQNVTFPYTVKIKRGYDDTIVKAEVKGYKPTMICVGKIFNPVSIINLTDILGWAIDAATGAITRPEYSYFNIAFEKEEVAE